MVYLTRMNGHTFVMNSNLIEIIEATPDTVITLTNGRKYIVKESVDEVVQRVIEFNNRVLNRV